MEISLAGLDCQGRFASQLKRPKGRAEYASHGNYPGKDPDDGEDNFPRANVQVHQSNVVQAGPVPTQVRLNVQKKS